MSSSKAIRSTDMAANGRRTPWPCMRCLNSISKGNVEVSGHPGCTVPAIDASSSVSLHYKEWAAKLDPDGDSDDDNTRPYVRCLHCNLQGQDCFAPPFKYKEHFVKLERLAHRFHRRKIVGSASDVVAEPELIDAEDIAGDEPDAANLRDMTLPELREARDEYVKHALDLHVALMAAYPKFADRLTAHNGSRSLANDPNSGVEFRGRDRSKMGTLARESRKKRAMEKLESSDIDEEQFTPRKKAKYGVKGVRKTKAEREAEAQSEEAVKSRLRKVWSDYNAMTAGQKSSYTKKYGRPVNPDLA